MGYFKVSGMGANKVECLALVAGLGEHRNGGGGADEPDLVAAERGQVGEQAAEAAIGRSAWSCWRVALPRARAERRGWGDGGRWLRAGLR